MDFLEKLKALIGMSGRHRLPETALEIPESFLAETSTGVDQLRAGAAFHAELKKIRERLRAA